MRYVLAARVVAALAGFAFIGLPLGEAAATVCSDATLRGGYGYTVTGTLFTEAGEAVFTAVGRIEFDGRGDFINRRTITIDGETEENVEGTGSYTLSSDCTGTLTFSDPGQELPLNANIVVDDRGKEIRMITTAPGVQLTVIGRKQ